MSKWIPITEQEPAFGSRVLFTLDNGQVLSGRFDEVTCEEVIAWQPLPEAYKPKEKKEYPMTVDEASWRLKEMYLNCECECQGDECDLCSKAVYKAIQDMEQVKTIKYELE